MTDPQLLLNILLEKRGLIDQKSIDTFLQPNYERDLSDPMTMHDMESATVRIRQAIESNERIAIYADYDADGVPGACVLHDFFKAIGYENFTVYIPHRHDEGYGVHTDAIDTLITDGVTLMITVDVGIGAHDAVVHAREKGVDMIITDHHIPPETLPNAYAIVHPKLGTYADPMLCGCAVAFQLVRGMIALLQKEPLDAHPLPHVGFEKWLLDLVGISTIADSVPLVNENRVLATYGLRVLRKTKRKGLLLLLKSMQIDVRHLTEDDVSFMIVPRINAASRMAHPEDAFRLLATTDTEEAVRLVKHLTELNDERKSLVARTMKSVHKVALTRETDPVIVVGDPDWHTGVLGLLASKIVEAYGKPAFVWTRETIDGEYVYKGSCRSAHGIDVMQLMECAKDSFVQFGGHIEAGGFSMTQDSVHNLQEDLSHAYRSLVDSGELHVVVKNKEEIYDAPLTVDDVYQKSYNVLQTLSPFGVGNPKPLFYFKDCVVDNVSLFGKTKNHLKLIFRNGSGRSIEAIQFFVDQIPAGVEPGLMCSFIGAMEESRFRGRPELRLRIEHFIS
ncbi:MAG: single-stranded-DNA-specific exonuclease RecJ [Candidatus Pacebacteria bacterium]|nr:single-stranded-DNA-specific exonuclease RecJ [Candidatus Paceibacterota bacterium]